MKRNYWIVGILGAALVGAGAFVATVTVGQHEPTDSRPKRGRCDGYPEGVIYRWLNLTEEQATKVREADPDFFERTGKMRKELDREREALAKLLEDDDAPDQAVLDQVEKMVQTHGRLEKSVAQHLLKIRKYLTPDQRKRLFGFAARGIRRHHGRRRSPRGPYPEARPWREGRDGAQRLPSPPSDRPHDWERKRRDSQKQDWTPPRGHDRPPHSPPRKERPVTTD